MREFTPPPPPPPYIREFEVFDVLYTLYEGVSPYIREFEVFDVLYTLYEGVPPPPPPLYKGV